MLNIQKTQDKLAIVIVGYNRLDSIVRLLNSLLNAEYYDMDVPLVISIDASNNEDLYTYARTFVWPFGEKHVIIHKKRLGLREHIFSCGDLTEYFKGIILLEDDIYVSAHFYKYALEACNYYDEDDKVACIALYSKNINESISIAALPLFFAIYYFYSLGNCFGHRKFFLFCITPELVFYNAVCSTSTNCDSHRNA